MTPSRKAWKAQQYFLGKISLIKIFQAQIGSRCMQGADTEPIIVFLHAMYWWLHFIHTTSLEWLT